MAGSRKRSSRLRVLVRFRAGLRSGERPHAGCGLTDQCGAAGNLPAAFRTIE